MADIFQTETKQNYTLETASKCPQILHRIFKKNMEVKTGLLKFLYLY